MSAEVSGGREGWCVPGHVDSIVGRIEWSEDRERKNEWMNSMNDEVDTAKGADASLARYGAPEAGCGYREGGDRASPTFISSFQDEIWQVIWTAIDGTLQAQFDAQYKGTSGECYRIGALITARLWNALAVEYGNTLRAEERSIVICRHLHFCLTAVREKTRVDGLMNFELNSITLNFATRSSVLIALKTWLQWGRSQSQASSSLEGSTP
jgi:hypothetical protein